MGNISYYGMRTICLSKLKEFFNEFQYTIIAPLISTLIFMILLSTISNYYVLDVEDNRYLEFVVPGIVMIVVMQTSYQNISETLINMKQIGSFNDYLISPISRIEILFALIISSIFIGVFIGLLNIFLLNFFVEFNSINFFILIYYLIICSIIFSSIGSIVGFLFYTWDVQNSISNFFVIPISFLSGTFFSINSVKIQWIFLFKFNPFYQLVNNFRQSFNEGYDVKVDVEIMLFILAFLFLIISMYIFNKGYKVIN